MQKVGIGWDAHVFEGAGPVRLGGADIPHEKGLKGHSDADALLHAICDALLGAAGLPDIGQQFPDTDQSFRGIDSMKLLARVTELLTSKGAQIVNVDSVVIAQEPKIAPYINEMKEKIARTLGVSACCVGVKGTTTERMGAIGRGEGIAAEAIAMIEIPDENY